jgi:hypothetical protein
VERDEKTLQKIQALRQEAIQLKMAEESKAGRPLSLSPPHANRLLHSILYDCAASFFCHSFWWAYFFFVTQAIETAGGDSDSGADEE